MASRNPFTEEDYQRLLKEESCNDKEEGWKHVTTHEHCDIWRKSEDHHSVHLVKAYLQFPGIPMDTVVELFTNIDERRKWDGKLFPHVEVIEEMSDYRLLYWQFKMPAGCTDRDLLQYMKTHKDESSNVTIIVMKNAKHQKVPEKKGFIRAETILSGMLVRPDSSDAGSSKVTLLVQNDIKGVLPKAAINYVATKAPDNWRASLSKYFVQEYSKRS